MIERKKINGHDVRYFIADPKKDEVYAAYKEGAQVRELAKAEGADLAINFNFANKETGTPIGRLIVDGQTVVNDTSKTQPRDELYMMQDRTLHIGKAPEGAVWAIQGSPPLLKGGKNVVRDGIDRDQTGADIWQRDDKRIAAGITGSGKLVIASTIGTVSLTEMAAIMAALGCVDALNGDGGGSCYFWYEDTGWGRKLGSALIVKRGVEKVKPFRIVLDAGHGPETPGKRCPDDSMREFLFNAATADFAAALLSGYEGVETLFTHAEIRDVPLTERTDKANAWGANVFVSIHANAFGNGEWNGVRGIETFVHESRPAAAVALANAVQRNLIRDTKLPDRGVKSADFHVLRATKMTSILIECGFMTNKEEAELLKSNGYRRKCAAAIVAGIAESYGLKLKTNPTTAKQLPAVQGWATYDVNGGEPKDALLIDNAMWIPLRAVSEGLGGRIAAYDNVKKHAKIEGVK